MAPAPFVLVQLTDCHVGARWDGVAALERLAAVLEAVRALRPRPDALLVTGDLSEHGAAAEYEQLRERLASLGLPTYVVPGNQDSRAELGRAFELGGADGERLHDAVDLGPLRLVLLDSIRPGEHEGELDAATLAWLDAALADDRETPTVVALHHPPVVTGVPAWDAICLAPADRSALTEVVRRHPQVRRIVAGHLHRTIVGELGGRPVLVAPSAYVQMRLDLRLDELELDPRAPSGFAVHVLAEGELVSHVQPVDPAG